MVKSMSAANQAQSVDNSVPKRRRHRSKVPMKPKLPLVGAGKTGGPLHGIMVSSSAFSTIPRAMRARIERASIPPQPRKEASNGNVATDDQLKHQPFVRSNSGKTALGPWSGPFGSGSMPDEEAPVLYLDRSGSAHMDLDDDIHSSEQFMLKPVISIGRERDERMPQMNSGEKSLSMSQKGFHQLITAPVPRMGSNLKVREEEMVLMQSKPLVKGNIRDKSNMKRGLGRHRVVGMITQPRRN